jgi:hypothetical protein
MIKISVISVEILLFQVTAIPGDGGEIGDCYGST